MTVSSVSADTIPSEHERRSDHLRRLLAIVDSTLNQICSLPSLTEDDVCPMSEPLETSADHLKTASLGNTPGVEDMSKENVCVASSVDVIFEPNDFQFQWNHYQEESLNDIQVPVLVSESDDLITFDWSVPPPTSTKQALTLSEAPERCLICDDNDWCSEAHDVVVDSKERSVTFAKTANKGVRTDHHPPVVEGQRTLEEIDNAVHAILTSLSSSKASQTETKKSPRRRSSVPEPRTGPTQPTKNKSSPIPNRSKMPTPKQIAKASHAPRLLSLARAAPPLSPTSCTFRESSIRTRTRPICGLAPSPRETRSMRDTHVRKALPVREARSFREPFTSRRRNSFPPIAKKGGKASFVMEPLMTVVRQIADTSTAAAANPDDVMLVMTKKDDPTSSVVCIQLPRKDGQNLRSVLMTLLAEHHPVDVGTMTDDPPPDKPAVAPQVRSVRDLGVGAGDYVVVVRPGLTSTSSATAKRTTSREATPSTSVIVRTKRPRSRDDRPARLMASCASMAHGASAQWLRRRRRWNRLRSQRQQTRSALRRNLLLTLCLSMLSLTFGSLSFSIVCEPSE